MATDQSEQTSDKITPNIWSPNHTPQCFNHLYTLVSHSYVQTCTTCSSLCTLFIYNGTLLTPNNSHLLCRKMSYKGRFQNAHQTYFSNRYKHSQHI